VQAQKFEADKLRNMAMAVRICQFSDQEAWEEFLKDGE